MSKTSTSTLSLAASKKRLVMPPAEMTGVDEEVLCFGILEERYSFKDDLEVDR